MVLKKVKLNNMNDVTVQFSISSGKKSSNVTVMSEDNPAPSFLKAMQDLAKDVVNICELGKESKVKISGVSWNYHGDEEIQGCVITAEKKLSIGNAVMIINTPMKYVDRTNKIPETQTLSVEAASRVLKLEEEVRSFVGGFREQVDMFV